MAEMHTPYSSLKRLLSFFNGFMVMCGVILSGLGIYVKFRRAVLTRVLGLSSVYLLHIGYLCLAMGCIAVLVGFAGWYGATRESRGTLCFLFTVIILIIEITVAAGVLALFHIVSTVLLLPVHKVALEHVFVALRKNHRGYRAPDDCSTERNLAMEKLKCSWVKDDTDFSCSSFEMTAPFDYISLGSRGSHPHFSYGETEVGGKQFKVTWLWWSWVWPPESRPWATPPALPRAENKAVTMSKDHSRRVTAATGPGTHFHALSGRQTLNRCATQAPQGCFLKITKTQGFNLSGGSLGAAVIQLPGILATLLLFIKLG
ncbi:tetraspanin-16 [Ailuropoda melanoleuca]|uniref:tetraspanin-16 n=1 Tax=Ailuropoda melanoleuca TaxID=9646 RepID=UPI001494E5B9|nr:tetraspanin-16 [Ailuropoda melanoleuca]